MRFRPGFGGAALGVPLSELRDLQVEVAELDRAFDADGEFETEQVVTRFLSAAAGREADPLVALATPRLLDQRVDSIARDLGISGAGLPPAAFLRVWR